MSSRIFVVEVLGFAPREANLLSRIGSLTSGRHRTYDFQEKPRQRPDMVVVDGGNPGALDAWQWAYAKRGVPTIFMSSKGDGPEGYPCLRLPLVPTRLLSLLDEITVNEIGYVPEVRIGESEDGVGMAAPARKTAGGIKVLVVDDSSTVRKQMELCLGLLGLDVTVCDSGEAALQKIATTRFWLVFLDVVMPGMDGYQVCKSIKKNREQKQTPVVMLTSKSSPFDRIKGSLAGCDTYLTKPVDNDTLNRILTQYLGARETWTMQPVRLPAG